jgi:AcrR family transcriptional regulator
MKRTIGTLGKIQTLSTINLPKPLTRRDARERRERLIEAAVKVFIEEGFDAPLERVAEEAKVGRGTLYRNFPDRQAIALAVLQTYLDDLSHKIQECGEADDALFVGIRALAELTLASNGFQKALPIKRQSPEYIRSVRSGIEAILAKPLERAKAAGLIRPDFPISDIHYLPLMLAAGGLSPEDGNTAAGMRRAFDLLASGFAPSR